LEEETSMRYNFFTPYSELSENLKTILKADEGFDSDIWDTGDDKAQWEVVETCFIPTRLQGTLTEEELDYLTDCNMHTIRRYFEGWKEADYLAYYKKRDTPPQWLKGKE
jgi:hypothetical protein